jgi:hypothetical protein
MTVKQRLRLIGRKKKIEALLPIVGPERYRRMRADLVKRDAILDLPTGPQLKDFEPGHAILSKIDGVGGLRFQIESPPGLGRLIRLPFYLVDSPDFGVIGAPATVTTDGGLSAPAVANPVVIVQSTARSLAGMVLQTPVIEWAQMRLVGFQATSRSSPASFDGSPVFPVVAENIGMRPFLLANQLQVGGGANLFPTEGYVDATIYTPFVPEFAGLRSYPIVRSPNNVSVRMAVAGQPGLGPVVPPFRESYLMTYSCNLICEILDDTQFGRHVPGPYARRAALARDAYPAGTSFVNA